MDSITTPITEVSNTDLTETDTKKEQEDEEWGAIGAAVWELENLDLAKQVMVLRKDKTRPHTERIAEANKLLAEAKEDEEDEEGWCDCERCGRVFENEPDCPSICGICEKDDEDDDGGDVCEQCTKVRTGICHDHYCYGCDNHIDGCVCDLEWCEEHSEPLYNKDGVKCSGCLENENV